MEKRDHGPAEDKPTRSGVGKESPAPSQDPDDRLRADARPRDGAENAGDKAQRPARDSEGSPQGGRSLWVWTCPACGFSQPDPAEECPKCGVVISKFQGKEAIYPDRRSPQEAWDDASDSSRPKAWTRIVLGIVVCALAAVLGLKWVLQGIKGRAGSMAALPGQALGQVKRFTVQNFGTAVVAASEKLPVLVEFYSHT